MPVLIIAGVRRDGGFQRARVLGEALAAKSMGARVVIKELSEFGYAKYVEAAKKDAGGRAIAHTGECFVTDSVEGYIGGSDAFVAWAEDKYGVKPSLEAKAAAEVARTRVGEYRKQSGSAFCYLDVKIGEAKELQRLVFELDRKVCPKTSDNFLQLCSGENKDKLCYKGSPFHRVVPGGWVQGGDIVSGSGAGGRSAYGGDFGDESFALKFDDSGILGMANKGPHTNASQFFITTKPIPALNGKKVAFGRLIEGSAALAAIEKVQLVNQRPATPVVVAGCGVL